MPRNRFGEVLVFILVLALVATVPLAGCKKKEVGPSEGAGGDPGGTGGVGGVGGSGGRELGAWNAGWNAKFAPGQSYRYTINTVSDGKRTESWFTLNVSDAGDGLVNVEYAGSFGLPFSGSFKSVPDDIDWQMGITDMLAWGLVAGLIAAPNMLDMAEHGWETGTVWSYDTGVEKISFAITGKQTYAGIAGAVGEWKSSTGAFVFCVNPYIPLALYVKVITDAKNYTEYVLTECGGF